MFYLDISETVLGLSIAGAFVVGAAVIAVLFLVLGPKLAKKNASREAKQILKEAETKAERIKKNAELDAKQAAFEKKQETQNEIREMKSEVLAQQNNLAMREKTIDQRDRALLEREKTLEEKNNVLTSKIEANDRKAEELDRKIQDIIAELEKVSGMSTKEAHDEIMARVESRMASEIASYIKNAEDEARDTAEAKAKDLLSLACDKYAQEVTTERTVAVIALPTDELKGRIIGREGRNIRVLEQTLGVDLVIDDTPDGRIQPGRIEDIAAKMKKEVETETAKAGEEAANKLGLPRIRRELLAQLGKLKYRTSYGQNALMHSVEVAHLAGIMAAELGLDQNLAKRAGLLHDIGKAVDFEVEGSHVALGADLARKYGEPDVVINAIESHHGDVEAKYVISHLVAAADTLSAARPGARSETMETYVKRITQLEEIAKGFDGVQQAYAVQAGREIRVMVIPEKVSDSDAVKLAVQMKDKIESTMTYPGQIKVNVIREYRAVETAK